jgi:ribonuclease HII
VGTKEREVRALGFRLVAGVDEAGRGSLFGPVFAAAVVLSPNRPVCGLRDSKLLTPERRRELAAEIRERAVCCSVAAIDAFVIDRVNIYQASRLALKRAVEQLLPNPDYLLVDALAIDLPLPQQPIVHGDAKCRAIAAASIVAKVERDAYLCEWDAVYPQYGLRRHKGYSTPEHIRALEMYGPTLHHRLSFEPVRTACPRSMWCIFSLRESLHFRWDPQGGRHGSEDALPAWRPLPAGKGTWE